MICVFISEIGIILNGISILHNQYDLSRNKLIKNADLRNSLLDAILKMSSAVLSEDINHFNFKKYKLIIKSVTLEAKNPEGRSPINRVSDLVVYCIGDPELKVSLIEQLLERITNEFLEMFPDLAENTSSEISKYRRFNPVFDRILADLKETPDRRFQGIF